MTKVYWVSTTTLLLLAMTKGWHPEYLFGLVCVMVIINPWSPLVDP